MSAPDALPEGWATATLGEVAVLQRGVTFPASASRGEPGEGTVPCLRTANVQKQLQWDDLLHIPAGYVSSERRWLREGDTVISMANSNERVGKVALAKGVPPGVTFGAFLSVIRSSLLDPEYLFHLLSSPAIQLAIHGTASRTVNIANLSIKGLRSVPLPIASLQEQRRIVARLEALQARSAAARRALDAIPDLQERYRQSVLRAACRGDLSRAWRASRPAVEPAGVRCARILDERRTRFIEEVARRGCARAEAQARAKGAGLNAGESERVLVRERARAAKSYRAPAHLDEADLPELPEGWCWLSVESLVFASETGLVRSARSQRSQAFAGSAPYVRMQNFDGTGRWFWQDLPFVQVEDGELQRYELRAGDVLFNTRNSHALVGKVAVWPEGRPGAVFNNNLRRLRAVSEVLPGWLAAQMQGPEFRERIGTAKSATTGVCALYMADLMGQAIALPPLEEQRAALQLVGAARSYGHAASDRHAEACEALDRLDRSILTRAFQGSLVRRDPAEGHAGALLDRISRERAQAGRPPGEATQQTGAQP